METRELKIQITGEFSRKRSWSCYGKPLCVFLVWVWLHARFFFLRHTISRYIIPI